METTAIIGFMYKRRITANTKQMTESKMEIRFCSTFSSMIEKFWLNVVKTYHAEEQMLHKFSIAAQKLERRKEHFSSLMAGVYGVTTLSSYLKLTFRSEICFLSLCPIFFSWISG